MSGGFWTLTQAAGRFRAIARDMSLAPQEIVEEACRMVETEAKNSLGSYHNGWPQLADSTQADRVNKGYPANEPGLRTGKMRDSIKHVVVQQGGEVVGHVGSNDDNLVYFELGTSKQPPRSVLVGAAMRQQHKIYAMARRRIVAAFAGRGSSAHNWREMLHIIEMGYEAVKGLAENLMPDDNDEDK